jgi:hypothetical protein
LKFVISFMPKIETIDVFYQETIGWMHESLRYDVGHFNVSKSDPYVKGSAKPTP